MPPNLTEAALEHALSMYLPYLDPSGLKRAKELYDPANYSYPSYLGTYSLPWWKIMRITTDGGAMSKPSRALGHCTVRRIARLFMEGGVSHVFVYMFSHPSQEGIPDMNVGD